MQREKIVVGRDIVTVGPGRPIRQEQKNKPETSTPSPAEQWDHVAFRLIQQELAPKGYSEIKRGPWRGKVKSNLEFLPKQTVINCQKISAQLVRTFRGKLAKQIQTFNNEVDEHIKQDEKKLEACRFWEFGKKRDLKEMMRYRNGQSGCVSRMLQELNNLPIK